MAFVIDLSLRLYYIGCIDLCAPLPIGLTWLSDYYWICMPQNKILPCAHAGSTGFLGYDSIVHYVRLFVGLSLSQ